MSATQVSSKVLDFYRTMPFNFYSSAEVAAERVKAANSIKTQVILEGALQKSQRVLDVGCGTGFLCNSIAYYYGCDVTGIDFNSVAIDMARDIAKHLDLNPKFSVQNLFEYEVDEPYDTVCSNGVLCHTHDCHLALQHIFRNLVRKGGYFFGGLYHRYGREPFLAYFADLKGKGLTEEQLYQKYKELHANQTDETHLRSWFRDQVLQPHETKHTLKEVVDVMAEEGMELKLTSINRFEPIRDLDELYEMETEYRAISEQRLRDKTYFPGFFTFLARKREA